MRKRTALFLSILLALKGIAQIDSINQRVFLVGDAGDVINGKHPVIDWMKANINWDDEKNTVVFLGDNIYPHGLPMEGEASYPYSKSVIDYQVSLVKGKKAKAYFIPGNHDWKNGKIGGWQQVTNQVDYINLQGLNNVEAWPREGCPGPVTIELSDKTVLVLMDSQWFLYVHDKPGPGSTCDAKTPEEFATALREIAATHPNQLLILAMHHPMYSYGVHGGDYRLRHHLFPFTEAIPWLYLPMPVIGSVYPIARGVFGNLQDVNHPLYRSMRELIVDVLKDHPNPIAVAGHEHSLQLIMKDSIPYIISGSAAELTRVEKKHKAEYAEAAHGFAVLEIRKSGKVEAKFYTLASANFNTPSFAKQLKPIVQTTPKPLLDTLYPLQDSIVVVANPALKGNGLKRTFLGRNYRQEWTQPVKVPVLDLGKEGGGLRPVKQGGGRQTKSLRLEDKNGKQWALRSIEKFPEAAIPADLRSTIAKDIVEDGVSASYPYASLSIGPLATATGVPYVRRKLVYVPDDPRLDRFRNDFKNTLAVLEEREPINIKKTDNTDELILKLAKDNDDHVDQIKVLKARLVDNFIMDFDRHEDQWSWATSDTGKGKLYYPIPRDHDQAFFTNQGLIPRYVRKPWLIPEIQGFRASTKDIKTFNRPARNFDRFFLNHINEEEWSRQVDTFLASMTDDVIERSLRQQPREIHGYNMQAIIDKLKLKRQYFKRDMMEYYKFISREVNIVGTNQREFFDITKNEDGTLHVIGKKIEKDGKVSTKFFERIFTPDVTKEIRVYGLQDNDSFHVSGGDTRIRIRLIGGSGRDHFINDGAANGVLAYDANFEENTFIGKFHDKTSSDPEVNRYNRFEYKYNFVNPGVSIEYNVDDGLYLGAQLEITRQGFRKEPYAIRHYFTANHALQTKSYHFRYEGDYIRVIGHHDLVVRGDLRAPINVTNFFGLGNNTEIDDAHKDDVQYYRARFDIGTFSALLRRQLQSWMRVSYGPAYQFFNVRPEENVGKFISNTSASGLDPANLYDRKSYLGAEFRLDINSKNNKVLPTRGAVVDGYVRPLFGMNDASKNQIQTGLDLSIFMSIVPQTKFVLATRFGVGHNFGHFEFPQAQYLSGRENLRGYRRDRFAGRTMLFNNTEVRLQLANFNLYLFNGAFGLLGFHDIGRVYVDNEDSRRWHSGYGGGIWLAPIRRFVVSAAIGFSKEEEKGLPLVKFGFQF